MDGLSSAVFSCTGGGFLYCCANVDQYVHWALVSVTEGNGV